VAPALTASATLIGTTEQIAVSGSGFTPGGTVTLSVIDQTTGTLLQSTPVQASVGTPTTTYVTETVWVPTYAPAPGPYCQPGYVCQPVYSAQAAPSCQVVHPPSGEILTFCFNQSTQFCPPGQLCQPTQFCPPGYTPQIGYTGQFCQPTQFCQPGVPCYPGQPVQYCLQTVSVPVTTYVGGGMFSTIVVVPYTTDTLLVEATDTAIGLISNPVLLTPPV
jgi:hypothetical protein